MACPLSYSFLYADGWLNHPAALDSSRCDCFGAGVSLTPLFALSEQASCAEEGEGQAVHAPLGDDVRYPTALLFRCSGL